jgi:hypothetical protein
LNDENWKVRSDTAKALGVIGDARAVEPLIQALKDIDGNVVFRESIANALGEIGDARAVEHFIQALKDKDEDVRSDAARLLGKIGDARALEPLIQARKDGHEVVRDSVAESLEKMGFEEPYCSEHNGYNEAGIERERQKLIRLCEQYTDVYGNGEYYDEQKLKRIKDRIRAIGQRLGDGGGKSLMYDVGTSLEDPRYRHIVDSCWDGICKWAY